MSAPPIPQRIPALTWRRPSLLWTPLSLALAIGWPAVLFYNDVALRQLALVAGAAVFALALTTLGAGWAMGQAPRARRIVVMHVVIAGAIASLAAPFVLTNLLAAVSEYAHAGSGASLNLVTSLAILPLALVLGLPIALASGVLFAWVALSRPRSQEQTPGDRDVQPFR